MHSATIDLVIDDEEFECEVVFSYTSGQPARLFGAPEDCYPAEPAEVSVEEITCNGIDIHEVIENEGLWEEVEEKCLATL